MSILGGNFMYESAWHSLIKIFSSSFKRSCKYGNNSFVILFGPSKLAIWGYCDID